MYKGINEKLTKHTAVELGLLELLKNARTFIRQLQLMNSLQLSDEDKKALETIKTLVEEALEGGRT